MSQLCNNWQNKTCRHTLEFHTRTNWKEERPSYLQKHPRQLSWSYDQECFSHYISTSWNWSCLFLIIFVSSLFKDYFINNLWREDVKWIISTKLISVMTEHTDNKTRINKQESKNKVQPSLTTSSSKRESIPTFTLLHSTRSDSMDKRHATVNSHSWWSTKNTWRLVTWHRTQLSWR